MSPLYTLYSILYIWGGDHVPTSIEYGVWSIEYGVWSIEYGVWSMEYGVWSMGYGVWSMEYGVGSMEDGVWSMQCGVSRHKKEEGSAAGARCHLVRSQSMGAGCAAHVLFGVDRCARDRGVHVQVGVPGSDNMA